MRILKAVSIVSVIAAFVGACSSASTASTPCGADSTETFSQACAAIQTATDGKCGAGVVTIPCATIFNAPCNDTAKTFCSAPITSWASAISAAADCAGATTVTSPQIACYTAP